MTTTVPIRHRFELRGETSSLRTLARDLWASRGLIRVLARKDFFVRYRRASFGVLWAVGMPLVQAVVLGILFTRLARADAGPVPYAVFVFSGILPWTFFQAAATGGAGAIVEGQSLATRIYFPRAVLPLVQVGSAAYGFVPGLLILAIMAVAFGVPVGLHLLWLVPAAGVMLLLSATTALVLAALQVYFRDVRHIVAAVMLPWFFASAVFYPLERVGGLRPWLEINPAVGMIQLFRAAIQAASPNFESAVWWTLGWIAALVAIAAALYRRYDRVFVDLL
jgi:lipopolysaccharide transport system permease protein